MLRWKENDERPKATAALRESLNMYVGLAQGGDEKFSHISEADKTKVVSNFLAFLYWSSERPGFALAAGGFSTLAFGQTS